MARKGMERSPSGSGSGEKRSLGKKGLAMFAIMALGAGVIGGCSGGTTEAQQGGSVGASTSETKGCSPIEPDCPYDAETAEKLKEIKKSETTTAEQTKEDSSKTPEATETPENNQPKFVVPDYTKFEDFNNKTDQEKHQACRDVHDANNITGLYMDLEQHNKLAQNKDPINTAQIVADRFNNSHMLIAGINDDKSNPANKIVAEAMTNCLFGNATGIGDNGALDLFKNTMQTSWETGNETVTTTIKDISSASKIFGSANNGPVISVQAITEINSPADNYKANQDTDILFRFNTSYYGNNLKYIDVIGWGSSSDKKTLVPDDAMNYAGQVENTK